jgi:hypothetical protein
MDLEKIKKRKRKLLGSHAKLQYKKLPPVHAYRSEDKNAPFEKWERITEKPLTGNEPFTDKDAQENMKFYYYKFTELDEFGNEGEPYDSPTETFMFHGKKYPRTPENFIVGIYLYWSIDPDLPLDQWTKVLDKPIKEENINLECPVKEPHYMYCRYVNALGDPVGKPSEIHRIVPKP